jgi:hypothetical protein
MIDDISFHFDKDEEWLCREDALLSAQPIHKYTPQHYHGQLDIHTAESELGYRAESEEVAEGSEYKNAFIE